MGGLLGVIVVGGVTVVVAVAGVAGVGGGVEHHGHAGVAMFVVEALQLWEHIALKQPGADDEHGAVCHFGYDLRVGNHVDGRAVDKDVVVTGAQLVDECGKTRLGKQLGGVWRNGAHGEDVERGMAVGLNYGRCNVVDATGEIVAKTVVRTADVGRCRCAAQVTVDDKNPAALQGDAGGGVYGQERLAAAWVERGEQRDGGFAVLALSITAEHELDVGAQHTERLVHHIAATLADNYLAASTSLPFFTLGGSERYLSCKGECKHLKVLSATQASVEAFTGKDGTEWHYQPQCKGHQQYVLLHRRCGSGVASRRRDDTGVVGGERLR